MTKINTIKNSIYRSTHLRSGNGISRAYHNTKNMSRLEASFATIEMLFAMNAARNHNLFNTIFMGGLTMYFTKKAVKFHNLKNSIANEYQDIVDRAKQIYQKG